jgi:hypothetical protein
LKKRIRVGKARRRGTASAAPCLSEKRGMGIETVVSQEMRVVLVFYET